MDTDAVNVKQYQFVNYCQCDNNNKLLTGLSSIRDGSAETSSCLSIRQSTRTSTWPCKAPFRKVYHERMVRFRSRAIL